MYDFFIITCSVTKRYSDILNTSDVDITQRGYLKYNNYNK